MNRNTSADLLKSIAIFGVVYIHGSDIFGCDSEFSLFIEWMFRFCVPVFIIVWAYFFEKSWINCENRKKRFQYAKKRFVHLFRVYLLWSVLYFVLFADWKNLTPAKILTTHFAGYGFAGQYFFIILFQLMIFYPFLRWIYSKRILRIASLVLVLISYCYWEFYFDSMPKIFGQLADRPFVFWIPYVFLGISLVRRGMSKIPSIYLLPMFFIVGEFYLLRNYGFPHSQYITLGVLFSSSWFGVSIMQDKIRIKALWLESTIKQLGSNTLIIFVSNPIVINTIRYYFANTGLDCQSPFGYFLVPLLASIIVLSICLLISILINRTILNGIIN